MERAIQTRPKVIAGLSGLLLSAAVTVPVFMSAGESRLLEMLFYLAAPGFFVSLIIWGAHGDGGHAFDVLALLINALVYAILVYVVLVLWNRRVRA